MKNIATSFLMIISIIGVSLFISKQTTSQRYRHNAFLLLVFANFGIKIATTIRRRRFRIA